MGIGSTSCASANFRGMDRTVSTRRGQERCLDVLLISLGECCAESDLWAIPKYV